jgi:hypothetical protein
MYTSPRLHYMDVMHCLLALMLAFQSATVLAVLDNREIMLAVRVGDVIYTAEFSRHALSPETFTDGDHVAVRKDRLGV